MCDSPSPYTMQAQSTTFQCTLCSRKYTRRFNLREHLRTHIDERPFLCTFCGKAFHRNHDRRTHERLHNGEKPWICGGTLKNGEHWGCNQRYARKSNLQRHFRSDVGQRCIKPQRDEESLERSAVTGLIDATRRRETISTTDLTQPQLLQVNTEHSAATTLTEIARTLDNGVSPRVSRVQPNISQAAASTSTYDPSTKLEWHKWDQILEGLQNGSVTQVTSSRNIHDLLMNIHQDKDFNVAALSSDPSKLPEEPDTLADAASAAMPVSGADTVPNVRKVAPIPSLVPAEKSFLHEAQQNSPEVGQRMDPALNLSFDHPVNDYNEARSSTPVEYTAATNKLLMWPSIKRLFSSEYDEDHVMRLEEEGSLISIHNQGQTYIVDDWQLPKSPSMHDDSGVNERDFNTDETSTSQSAAAFSDVDADADVHMEAEIDRFGLFKLDGKTAQRYYQTYVNCMHKLHPFLNQSELGVKVDAFIGRYCPRTTSPTIGPKTLCPEKKRKRSYDDTNGTRGASSSSTRPRVGRTVDNAIIVLVFALGAICECRSPTPSPIIEENANFEQQDIPRLLYSLRTTPSNSTSAINRALSSANLDSALSTISSFYGTLRVTDQAFLSSTFESNLKEKPTQRAMSPTHDQFGHAKNLRFIPGSSLYGFATAILGNLQGGVKLEYVQAALLAGLYAGQLAYSFQSHGWICQAARTYQVLVRQKRYARLEEGAQRDLHRFAYWTCLQLENDLLAEFDLTASGIARPEYRIDLPKGRYTIDLPDDLAAPSTMMMLYYLAQIYLCITLKLIYTDLSKLEKLGPTYGSSSVLNAHSQNLMLWRSSLPETMMWTDEDPPATEINAARMRAKYYSAQYIIHRPELYHVLHSDQRQSVLDILAGSSSFSLKRFRLRSRYRLACRCLDSLISNTEAFDGIEEPLTVPNIFGTAHAQFGNMLVLSATYTSSLSELVDRSTLERLLKRTILFLRRHENFSPTLRTDARILSEIYEKIFGAAASLDT